MNKNLLRMAHLERVSVYSLAQETEIYSTARTVAKAGPSGKLHLLIWVKHSRDLAFETTN